MDRCSTQLDQYMSSARETADAFCREVYVLGAGIGGGAVKEIQKHPMESAKEAGCSVGAGLAVGALAAAELPVVSIGAAAVGGVLTGKYVYDLVSPSEHNCQRNSALATAFQTAWNTNDPAILGHQIAFLQDTCGPDSLSLLEGVAAGASCRIGTRLPHVFRNVSPLCTSKFAFIQGENQQFMTSDLLAQDGAKSRELISEYVAFIRKNGPVFTRRIVSLQGKPIEAQGNDRLIPKATNSEIVEPATNHQSDQRKMSGRPLVKDKILGEPHGGDCSVEKPSFYFKKSEHRTL